MSRRISPRQEVPEIHELAMSFILDIDGRPSGFASSDSLPVDDYGLFRTNHSKRDHVLLAVLVLSFWCSRQ